MGKFLQGWKRKAGCLTLMMACICMGGWVRSGFLQDSFVIPLSDSLHFYLLSTSGRVIVLVLNGEPHSSDFWRSQPAIQDGWKVKAGGSEFVKGDLKVFQLNLFGVGLSIFDERVMLPYWSIVIPLTLISACLLLSKTRQSTSRKITAPNANDGVES